MKRILVLFAVTVFLITIILNTDASAAISSHEAWSKTGFELEKLMKFLFGIFWIVLGFIFFPVLTLSVLSFLGLMLVLLVGPTSIPAWLIFLGFGAAALYLRSKLKEPEVEPKKAH